MACAVIIAAWLSPFGIDVGYYLHLAAGQWRLLRNRVPIEEVVGKAETSVAIQSRLRLAQDIRRFAVDELGLAELDTYTFFSDIGDRPVAWSLTVCQKDCLEPYKWTYPIVGEAPYRGFFERSRGEEARASYEAKGYDTYLRPVGAFSTLGWFSDPLLSTMLARRAGDLADTIVHEMVHATVWVRGHADFNESVASFVGHEGAARWLAEHFGAASDSLIAYRDARDDGVRLGRMMHTLASRLDSVYRGNGGRQVKLKARSRLFDGFRTAVKSIAWKTARYGRVDAWTLNNAVLVLYLTYDREPLVFARVLRQVDGDLAAFIRVIRLCESSDDPYGFLETWLVEHDG